MPSSANTVQRRVFIKDQPCLGKEARPNIIKSLEQVSYLGIAMIPVYFYRV